MINSKKVNKVNKTSNIFRALNLILGPFSRDFDFFSTKHIKLSLKL